MRAESGLEKPGSSLMVMRPVLRELSELRAIHGSARIVGSVPSRYSALRDQFCRLESVLGAGRDCDLMLLFQPNGTPRVLVRAMGIAVAYAGDAGVTDFMDDFSDFR